MKHYILIIIVLLSNIFAAFGQTTAVDFTANDCSGTSHHLFSELDAGKIIVVSFVDPCTSCIAPSQNAMWTVQGYATSNPGKVLFYISDDAANTSCATLTSWASHNGLTGYPIFSDPSFVQSQYGVPAMPKIVVLAGTGHHVYFVQDNALDVAQLTNAINSALLATYVPMMKAENFGISVFPNPATDNISVSFTLSETSDVNLEICNIIGAKVYSLHKENQAAGRHDLPVVLSNSIGSGIYFVKLTAQGYSEQFRFVVER